MLIAWSGVSQAQEIAGRLPLIVDRLDGAGQGEGAVGGRIS